ncbi:hypothetical protein HYS94_02230 [Candidatus Daviesbacteria bacterium]|nr:hypothetical protein [Candidatus Daviesbacteria bacterium]
MTYENMTIDQIFQFVYYRREKSQAQAWVEAENDFAVRAIIGKWFKYLEEGIANDRYPDPLNTTISQERADKLIEELDADFMIESGRFANLGVETGPEFFRLEPYAKRAFAQDIWSVMKTDKDIEMETVQRLNAGEELPPKQFQYENSFEEDYVIGLRGMEI